jgi:hypothetical protein
MVDRTGRHTSVPGKPAMTETLSSNVRAVGYAADERELWIGYKNTPGYYVYAHVPAAVYEGLLAAPSKGRFMHEHVLGRFDFRHEAS